MGSCVSRHNTVHSIRSIPPHIQSAGVGRTSDLFSQDASPTSALDGLPRSGVLPPSKKFDLNYTTIPNKVHKRNTIWDNQVFGLVGLRNLGNTCFMNSALQCLLNIPPLTDYFLSELHLKEINTSNFLGSKGEVANAYADLVREFWENNTQSSLSPDKFYSSISSFAPQFGNGTQEDSHDFLAILLDVIHEDLNRVKQRPNMNEPDLKGKSLQEQATSAWKHHLLRNRSIIVDLLQGQIKSSLKCLDCEHLSYKYEPFMYLSLPIPEDSKKEITLNQCLDEFIKEEKLDKEERWCCPECKSVKDSSKKIDIWTLPNILIVHLKRFQFTRQKRGKIKTGVNFPIKDLNLSNYLGQTQKDKPIYDLFAISCHEGNLGGGHYTSYVKNRDTNSWYFVNDSIIKEVDLSKVKTVHSTGYMLLYSKTSVDSFARQTISDPSAWPHFPVSRKVSVSSRQLDEHNVVYESPEENKGRPRKMHSKLGLMSQASLIENKKGLSLMGTPVKARNNGIDKSYNYMQMPLAKSVSEAKSYNNQLMETSPKRRLKNRDGEMDRVDLLKNEESQQARNNEDERLSSLPSINGKQRDSSKSPVRSRLDSKRNDSSHHNAVGKRGETMQERPLPNISPEGNDRYGNDRYRSYKGLADSRGSKFHDF